MMDGSMFSPDRLVACSGERSADRRQANTVAVETSRRSEVEGNQRPLPLRLMGNVVLKDNSAIESVLGHKVTTDALDLALMSGFSVQSYDSDFRVNSNKFESLWM